MEISRLIFKKETKEKMEKELNTMEKNKILSERIKEIAENGKLDACRTRREVARAVGYTADREQAGYVWVASMVRQGKLEERIYGIGKNGMMEYEYKYIENPEKHAVVVEQEENLVSKRKKGEMRWQIIMKCAANGKLAKCRTRKEVAKLAGYGDDEMDCGYSWVMNMLTRKHLVEKKLGYDKEGKMMSEFSIGKQPNYRLGKKKGVKRDKKEEPITKIENTNVEQVVEKQDVEPEEETKTSNVVVTYGELKIEFNEETNADMIKEVIMALIDKVKGE